MALLAIRMEDTDLQELKKQAEDKRIPFTIYARSLIVQGMKDASKGTEQESH